MEYSNKLKLFLDNFRMSEASGYISALIDTGNISAERGEDCRSLIQAYARIVQDSMWNEEGIFLLSTCHIDNNLSGDICDERDRLITIIKDWTKCKKKLILVYTSAYYAVANMDGLRLEMFLDEILKNIGDEYAVTEYLNAIGGYEKFQTVGNALERYCGLCNSALGAIKEVAIDFYGCL